MLGKGEAGGAWGPEVRVNPRHLGSQQGFEEVGNFFYWSGDFSHFTAMVLVMLFPYICDRHLLFLDIIPSFPGQVLGKRGLFAKVDRLKHVYVQGWAGVTGSKVRAVKEVGTTWRQRCQACFLPVTRAACLNSQWDLNPGNLQEGQRMIGRICSFLKIFRLSSLGRCESYIISFGCSIWPHGGDIQFWNKNWRGKTEVVRENFHNSRLGGSDDISLACIQLFLCQCSQRCGKQWALFSLSLGTKCENVLWASGKLSPKTFSLVLVVQVRTGPSHYSIIAPLQQMK